MQISSLNIFVENGFSLSKSFFKGKCWTFYSALDVILFLLIHLLFCGFDFGLSVLFLVEFMLEMCF
jgi:hypothetical protein